MVEKKPLELIELPESCTSLVEWVKKEERAQGACTPCGLAVIAPWYRDLLRGNGYEVLAKKVESLADDDQDARSAARVLDDIREAVDNEVVKSHLRMYDCNLQTYGGD